MPTRQPVHRRKTLRRMLVALVMLVPFGNTRGEDCVDCHEADPAAFAETVHGFLDCTDCHAGASELPHAPAAGEVACEACHEDASRAYATSIHGTARQNGVQEAPGCASCHGDLHQLVPVSDPASLVSPERLAETCGRCHSDPAIARKYSIDVVRPVEAYRQSVHARSAAEGADGATCSACHGSHDIQPGRDPRSHVHHERVPETCGQCHGAIAEAYGGSVHGLAAARGVRESPVCTDCHGEHRILSPRDAGSPVFPTNVPLQTCGRCHSNLRLGEKYGLDPAKIPEYEDSYHGLAARSGVQSVAHCASCHGVHDILPSSDPRSHVNAANLAETCGQCHPGAGARFAIGPVHVSAVEPADVAMYYVRLVYLPVIWLTIGGMLLHNLMDLFRKARMYHPAPPPGVLAAERMSRGFRIAHLGVITSFPVLVYTGFALTYPESWWARPLLQWEASLGLRAFLHRAAAVALLTALGYHLVHLVADRRARRCIAGMRPTMEDVHEFRERLAFYLGRRREPPPAPRLGYIEKAEYLAFLWGMVVMAGTGFLLWFENATLRWLPKWVSDAATAVHFYEAVLASLAILVWHLYWVIFDPLVYPMDTTWITGRPPLGRALERGEVQREAGDAGQARSGARAM